MAVSKKDFVMQVWMDDEDLNGSDPEKNSEDGFLTQDFIKRKIRNRMQDVITQAFS